MPRIERQKGIRAARPQGFIHPRDRAPNLELPFGQACWKIESSGKRRMTREELRKIRQWADTQIATAELSSAWYQLMKLREALDAILAGVDGLAIVTSALPQGCPSKAYGHLRLIDTAQADAAPPASTCENEP
jgi:hypothetical protein